MDQAKFFRRRQFALGPEYFNYLGWNRIEVAEGFLLTAHPDLPVARACISGRALTMVGYAIDPIDPGLREEQILRKLLEEAQDVTEVSSRLERLTGRFIIIANYGGQMCLFHDAVALRQVQYCKDGQGRTWCASQAETLAERFGFPLDEEVLDYKHLPAFRGKTEFWLLNDRTPYRQVLNLLPNHFLDLNRGTAVRYWPKKGCIPKLSVAESIRLCTPLLVNAIKAASERFDLRVAMTAGIDSRKTLAATKTFSDKLYYFSHGTSEETLQINDVAVPARLLGRLNLEHHAWPLLPMTEKFKNVFEASSTWAREKKGKNAYTVLANCGPEVTVLNSNISEVAQSIYWLPPSKLNGEGLAVLSGLAHPFAIKEFQKWLKGAKASCAEAGMDVLALFFLEQRMGRWATAAFSEYDVAHETFNPYNNRYLHSLMLGVNERYRRDRMWNVSLQNIKVMWPEVLAEPINPQDHLPAKVQQFIRRYVIHKTIAPWLPLYPYMRYLKKQRKFRKLQKQHRSGS
jgi:hypothetical protein